MKKQINWKIISAVLVAAALTTVGYHRLNSVQSQRHLQHRLADARTVVAAVRYLLQPESPVFQPPTTAWVMSQTPTSNPAAGPVSRESVSDTNLTSLTVSNGIAVKHGEATVPG